MFSAPAEARECPALTSRSNQIPAENDGNSAKTSDFPNNQSLVRTAPSAGALNDGRLAQPVAASALHAEGREFDPLTAHHPYKEIKLTRGYVALVSPEDYDRVAAHKWTAMPIKGKSLVYARRSVWVDGKCRTILLHRFIARTPAGVLTDHRDGNGLDCRQHNLRSATHAQNSFNKRFRRPATGLIGVSSQTPGRYRAAIKAGGKRVYTKTFPSPALAAAARDLLAKQLHGEFAVLNF
jgi:hypothetical protein